MTVSTVTAWSLTARQIISMALEEVAIPGIGKSPKANELQAGLDRLNALLKSWQAKGGNLFRETEADVAITGGDGIVTLPAGVRSVSSVRLVISATNQRLLHPFTRSEYLSLPNKTAVGSPTIYYLSRQRDAAELHIWPVPSTNQTLKIDYARVGFTVMDASETIDIPEEWQEAVYTNLAVQLARVWNAPLPPELVARAQRLETEMLDADRPDSYYFEPAYY